MVELIFLGTGGGRFVMITQRRRTGGIRILSEDLNLHLDPGPGALIHSIDMNLDPQKINAIFVSHSHPDHVNDAEVLVEAMSHGARSRRGTLVASRSVIHGNDICEQSISNYHQEMLERIIEASADKRFRLGDLDFKVTRAVHSDPDTVGFRVKTDDYGEFAYTSDSEYFDGIEQYYEGVRLLILCVLRPSGKPWKGHMTTDDAVKIIKGSKPEMAIITHFGMQMLYRSWREAKHIEEETGVPTRAAVDGMKITFNEEIKVNLPRRQMDLGSFIS